jgi:8-hydroxy-5-deazaflavin:NADPH oxidoreductase
MKIATIGRGNIGGALAKRWRATGHEVTEFGSDGGNATGSDAVLVAIPSNAIENAFTKVAGINDAVVLDATNAFTGREEDFESLAHQVKSHVEGPVAKAFNCNYGALYGEIDSQRVKPCCFYAAESGAVGVAELLIRDAGFHPVSAGGLGSARMLEDHLGLMTAINEGGLGRFFYRYARPGEL